MQPDRDSISQVEGSAPSEQLDFDPVEQRFGETEHDAAIYCKFCQMWLNGPTQWADHNYRPVAQRGRWVIVPSRTTVKLPSQL